jgi:hypothetical protein
MTRSYSATAAARLADPSICTNAFAFAVQRDGRRFVIAPSAAVLMSMTRSYSATAAARLADPPICTNAFAFTCSVVAVSR